MPITCTADPDSKQVLIELSGRFDFSCHQAFRAASARAKEQKGMRIVIDLADVEYMDSSALGMLLILKDEVGAKDGEITISHCRKGIRDILAIANFERLFTIA